MSGSRGDSKLTDADVLSFFDNIYNGNIKIVERYLNQGISPNILTLTGSFSALQTAVRGNQAKIAELLIMRGAEVQGQDLVYFALQNNNLECAKLLLQQKADVNENNVRAGDVTPIYAAIAKSNVEAVKLLIELKANLKVRTTTSGMTPLGWAEYLKKDSFWKSTPSEEIVNIMHRKLQADLIAAEERKPQKPYGRGDKKRS